MPHCDQRHLSQSALHTTSAIKALPPVIVPDPELPVSYALRELNVRVKIHTDGCDNLYLLLGQVKQLRILRLIHLATSKHPQRWPLDAACSIAEAVGEHLRELDFTTPFCVRYLCGTFAAGDTREEWSRLLSFLPTLETLTVRGTAHGLALAGSEAPSIRRLTLSGATLSDYEGFLTRLGDPSWFAGLCSLPRIRLLPIYSNTLRDSYNAFPNYDGQEVLSDAEETMTEGSLVGTLQRDVPAFKSRSTVVCSAKDEADLLKLPHKGWNLMRAMVLRTGDRHAIHAFKQRYGWFAVPHELDWLTDSEGNASDDQQSESGSEEEGESESGSSTAGACGAPDDNERVGGDGHLVKVASESEENAYGDDQWHFKASPSPEL